MVNEFNDLKTKTEINEEEIKEIYEQGEKDYKKIISALDQHRFIKKFDN